MSITVALDSALKRFENEYPSESVLEGLKIATKISCQRYFRTQRVEVDMDYQLVNVDLVLPKDMAALYSAMEIVPVDYFPNDPFVPVDIPFESVPKRIINMIRSIITECIINAHEINKYQEFKQFVRGKKQIVEGVIVYDSDPHVLEVDVNGTTCYFPRRYWINSEKEILYKIGKTAMFQITSVTKGNGKLHCYVTLSRRTKELPQILLKANYPTANFICQRRIPGKISWIKTNGIISDPNLKEAVKFVNKELSGEYINISN